MQSRAETTIKALFNCLQTAKIYGTTHPMFQKSLDSTYMIFQDALSLQDEITIGIVGQELAFEKEIIFDSAGLFKPMILYLKERNIERLAFSKGINRDELNLFINFLARPKEDFKVDPQELLKLTGTNYINVGKLKIDDSISRKPVGKTINLYDSGVEKIGQALNGVLNSEKIDHLALKFSLNNIMDSLSAQRHELLRLATIKRYDAETYTHMLNVAIFSMYFASRLGFDKTNILDIGLAAMFHDIGKLSISRKILHKAGQLSEEEFSRIRSHTFLGAEIMLKYVDSLGILPVVVSFEHHLKYDLSGYPRFPLLRKQHVASSIVSICDVYDALSQRRGYKQDYSPDVVYNIMNKEREAAFDPELFDKFFKFIGLWPVGSVVALSDSSIALVKAENESDITRPIVEIVSPVDKKRVVDLVKDYNLTVERYLNPWKEGKEYLDSGS